MTTKPTARKFRIRRSESLNISGSEAIDAEASKSPTAEPEKPAAWKQPADTKRADAPAEPPAAEDSAPQEAFTAKQLRMARRTAQRMGIAAATDEEAVHELRKRGVNPFKPANRLKIVEEEPPKPEPAAAKDMPVARIRLPKPPKPEATLQPNQHLLPQTVPEKPPVPSVQVRAEDQRAKEIMDLQQDIARRRRRTLSNLFLRLAVLVLLPTLVAGFYFSRIATPLYATDSEFYIQQSEAANGNSLGFLRGTGLATSQDSINVQGFLLSREAMLRLDEELGFRAHYSDPSIDAVQRLDADASNDEMYKLYQRFVTIGYDPTEGIIRMEIRSADPQKSVDFSEALVRYAEEHVDQSTQRMREDQMQGARDSYEEAEAKMLAAQERVLELQEQRGVLSAEAEISSIMGQISTFEVELKQETLILQSLLDNPRPNQAKVDVAEANIARLTELIGNMRAELTESDASGVSLAKITGELVVAEADLETRQLLLSQSLQQLETARIEANRQVRYLVLGVRPSLSDEPAYPRVRENTALAFLIFMGIYLMGSMTISVLREQVSS